MTESCRTCRFAHDHPEGFACRRYPPRIVATTTIASGRTYHEIEAKYPEVFRDEWCGEYQEHKP